jgi:tagatose-1,6-bisphosphate aldolase non-catalytic subunit AgaZ/GatZ
MPNPTKLIVDCSTGVTTEVELTDEEVAQRAADAAAFTAEQAAKEAAEATKAAAKQAAQDKLKALGLSDLEVAAITGA